MLDCGVICWVQKERVFVLGGGILPHYNKGHACVCVGSRTSRVSYTVVSEKDNTVKSTRSFTLKRCHVSNGFVSAGLFAAVAPSRRHSAICKYFVWHRGAANADGNKHDVRRCIGHFAT